MNKGRDFIIVIDPLTGMIIYLCTIKFSILPYGIFIQF
jgi:hypothetical protein